MFSAKGSFFYNPDNIRHGRLPKAKPPFFRFKNYSRIALIRKIKQLEFNCALHLDPMIRTPIIQEDLCMRTLKLIVNNTDRKILQSLPEHSIRLLIESALVLVHAFLAHLKTRTRFWEKFKARPYAHAMKYFHLLCFKLIPELFPIVMDQVMKFFKSERLWNGVFVCCEILSMLAFHSSPSVVLSKILNYLEENLDNSNVKEARYVNEVVQNMLLQPMWDDQKAEECSNLIRLYHASVAETDTTNSYFQMRRGFEMCLIRMCESVATAELIKIINLLFDLCFQTNLRQDALNNYGHTLETVITFVDYEIISDVLDQKKFGYLLKMIVSDNPQASRIGCRLLARMFDRQNNFGEFKTTRIFLPNKNYNINISNYHKEDNEFFKYNRLEIQINLLSAVRKHHIAANLDLIYTILCTIIVGQPSCFTATQISSLVLDIQEFALSLQTGASSTETNKMHALVISVLMLVAWVHRASSLSLYVQKLLNRRSNDAPHLNPPIKIEYQYAQHHVTWKEPKLYFDFWIVWYGLWKRFRAHEPQLLAPSEKLLLLEANNQAKFDTGTMPARESSL